MTRPAPPGQLVGQRAFAGADLDDEVARGRRDEIDDGAGDAGVAQEVLAERPALAHDSDRDAVCRRARSRREAAAVGSGVWREMDDTGIVVYGPTQASDRTSRSASGNLEPRALTPSSRLRGADRARLRLTSRAWIVPGVAIYLHRRSSPGARSICTPTCIDRWGGAGPGFVGHYRPGGWVPHCTLAKISRPSSSAALSRSPSAYGCRSTCRLVEVGIVEFRPVKHWSLARSAAGAPPTTPRSVPRGRRGAPRRRAAPARRGGAVAGVVDHVVGELDLLGERHLAGDLALDVGAVAVAAERAARAGSPHR